VALSVVRFLGSTTEERNRQDGLLQLGEVQQHVCGALGSSPNRDDDIAGVQCAELAKQPCIGPSLIG
jgi:hypothetical protein